MPKGRDFDGAWRGGVCQRGLALMRCVRICKCYVGLKIFFFWVPIMGPFFGPVFGHLRDINHQAGFQLRGRKTAPLLAPVSVNKIVRNASRQDPFSSNSNFPSWDPLFYLASIFNDMKFSEIADD